MQLKWRMGLMMEGVLSSNGSMMRLKPGKREHEGTNVEQGG